jgi:hypothetical protein
MVHDEDDDDELLPWERYEKLVRERIGESAAPQAGEPVDEATACERILTFWKYVLMGTFTGRPVGLDMAALAQLVRYLSAADVLLTQMVGCGAVTLLLTFHPKLAAMRADELEAKGTEGALRLAGTLRRAIDATADSERSIPMTSLHLMAAAMLYWAQDQEITWPAYCALLPRLISIPAPELVSRLGLTGPCAPGSPPFVRFENRHTGQVSRDYGPYEWVEVAHDEIKVAPDGARLATAGYPTGDADVTLWTPVDHPSRHYTNIVIGPAAPAEPPSIVIPEGGAR